MSCECDCEPVEVLITSLGPQDDDLRVRVNNTVAFDGRMNVGWYSGEGGSYGAAGFNPLYATSGFRIVRLTREVMHALGCRILPGSVISVDVFDGWAGSWQTSPWRADVLWSNGETSTFTGGSGTTGGSIIPAPSYESISLAALFPAGGYTDPAGWPFGDGFVIGPFPVARWVYSHSADPAGADDDLAINGVKLFPDNLANYVNAGATTFLHYLPAGSTFILNLWNAGGSYWAIGSLRLYTSPLSEALPSDYYATGPHFEAYIENGTFVVPCPPTSQPSAGVLVTPYG